MNEWWLEPRGITLPNRTAIADGLLFPESLDACRDGPVLLVEIRRRAVGLGADRRADAGRGRHGALSYRLAYLELEPGDTEVLGNEPVYAAGEIAGVTTSGGYGHWVGKSLAFAYVKPELAEIGTALEIAVLGQRRKAKVIAEPVYDPGNERSRG